MLRMPLEPPIPWWPRLWELVRCASHLNHPSNNLLWKCCYTGQDSNLHLKISSLACYPLHHWAKVERITVWEVFEEPRLNWPILAMFISWYCLPHPLKDRRWNWYDHVEPASYRWVNDWVLLHQEWNQLIEKATELAPLILWGIRLKTCFLQDKLNKS